MSGVLTSFGKLLFEKWDNWGNRILIAGLKICFTGVFNLNYKEGFEKENQIYKVYNIYNK